LNELYSHQLILHTYRDDLHTKTNALNWITGLRVHRFYEFT